MRLSESAVLITGGASGLGAETARAFVDRGAVVTIVDVDTERASALVAELGDQCGYVEADVTDAAQVEAAVAAAAGQEAPLRVAVNCAGIGPAARVLGRDGTPHDLDLFARVVGINLVGTFNVLRLAAAAIARTEPVDDDGQRGVIVNTASVAAYEGQIGQIAYAASKGGVASLTLPAARDLASSGIRVCTIAPGVVATPMLAGVTEEFRKGLSAGVPFPKRLARPDEYAELAAFVVEHGYMNGEVIRMDAALRMAPR